MVNSRFLEIGQKGSERPLGILSGVDLSEHNCKPPEIHRMGFGQNFLQGYTAWQVRMGGFDVEVMFFFQNLFDIAAVARPYRQIPGLDRYRSIQHVTCEFQGLEDQWSQDPCPRSFETYFNRYQSKPPEISM